MGFDALFGLQQRHYFGPNSPAQSGCYAIGIESRNKQLLYYKRQLQFRHQLTFDCFGFSKSAKSTQQKNIDFVGYFAKRKKRYRTLSGNCSSAGRKKH